MPGLIQFFSKTIHFWAFLVLLLISMKRTYNQDYTVRYKTDKLGLEIAGKFGKISRSWALIFKLKEENQKLLEENGKLYRLYMNSSFSYPGIKGMEIIPAQIVSRYIQNSKSFLIVDKGSKNGIIPGDGVWSPDGVIGIVSHVSPHFAKIYSFEHPKIQISIKLKNKSAFGFTAKDERTGKLTGTDFPEETPAKPGDTLVTSGMSLIFPQGIPVGTIYKIETTPQKDKIFYIKPFVNLNKISYIYVSHHPNRLELKKILE